MTGACPLCKGAGSVKVTQANGDETIVPCYPACTSGRTLSWPICDSRGPRIGDDGVPYCRRPAGHHGHHRPDPEDGWGNVTWTDMLREASTLRQSIGWQP